ncbi:hypothetical protein RvY_18237 [Ramazzottius varieornatus]|uniref:Uncharacterized protein n=1 Tax=Ramazzottius varieornatus TaxID=947166 RepID=A0A1D1W556_RAMVA|nr:hypothetical protein RvY_18237 [Ramazzottius varieornatus]
MLTSQLGTSCVTSAALETNYTAKWHNVHSHVMYVGTRVFIYLIKPSCQSSNIRLI